MTIVHFVVFLAGARGQNFPMDLPEEEKRRWPASQWKNNQATPAPMTYNVWNGDIELNHLSGATPKNLPPPEDERLPN